MENIPILRDLIILVAVSVPVTILFHSIGLPPIMGFIMSGVMIGPYGMGLVTEIEAVELLAQIGVIVLMFIIGMEFSMTKMMRLRKEGLIGGGLQVLMTSVVVIGITVLFGHSLVQSTLIGFVIALSSTAIVLKVLGDRGEVDTPAGNLSLSILLFQDICVVPMIIILQAMGRTKEITFLAVANPLFFAALAIGIILAASYILVPRILAHVVSLRNREVFTLSVLLLCFGTAWLTSYFGLSLALGAFIAGLVISDSEYSHQITAEILSFRDAFLSLFFISIGMLVDLRFFAQNISLLILVAAGIILLKIIIIATVGQLLKYPLRLSLVSAMGLAQIGEFSFVLMKMGDEYGLLTSDLYQTLLAASVISMSATPFLIQASHDISFRVAKAFGIKGTAADSIKAPAMTDHVIIIGYGLNGSNLARVLKETGIKYVIIDMNMERVRQAKKDGHKAFFGDSSHIEILHKLHIEKARMLVVAISDPASSGRTVKIAREASKSIYILVRTRYTNEVDGLYKLGANQVIPEEFETSIEIFSRVLREYHVPGNVIQNQIEIVRHEGYAMFRTPSLGQDKLMEVSSILSESVTETFYVSDNSPLIGKALAEIDLRKKSGVMVIAVVRKSKTIVNPAPDFTVEGGDILAIIGSHAEMDKAIGVLKGDAQPD